MLKKFNMYILMVLYLIFIFCISKYLSGNDLKIYLGNAKNLSKDWTLMYDENNSIVDLPIKIDVPSNTKIIMEKKLTKDFLLPMSIRLRSSMQNIKVYLDEELIFDNGIKKQKGILYEPEVSAWYIVELPQNSQDKILKLIITSKIEVMSGRLNEIYYGSKSDLVNQLIGKQLLNIVLAFFILGIGILTFFVSLIINIKNDKRLKYLSIFILSVGIWLISEIDIMQIFTGNSYIVGSISYLILPVATINFLLFIKEVVLKKYNKIINFYVFSFEIYLVTSILLQLIFNINYINSFIVFNIIMFLGIITIFSLLLYESIKNKTQDTKKYVLIISFLVITAIIEVVKFLIGDFMNISHLSIIGVAIFLILLMLDTLNYINQVFQKEKETKYLEEIAYKDILTKGLNRAAFEKDVDILLTNKTYFRLIMFDLNDLKVINDKFGHKAGDEAIKDFYKVLTITFDKVGDCYRIGGDEFMVISKDISEETFKSSIDLLKRIMGKIEKNKSYVFQCSYGTGIYKHNKSFRDFKHDVDLKMYQNKANFKKTNKKINKI